MSATLAIDIGGTKTLLALVDGPHIIAEKRISTRNGGDPGAWLAAIADAASDWRGQYDAVGAAVTGNISDGKWSALNPATLPVPDRFPLADDLLKRLGVPVVCINDAQAAAWGEYCHGAGQGLDMVFLTVSTGIGGGVVIGGRLLTGRNGLAGSAGITRIGMNPSSPMIEDRAAGHWMASAARDAGHDVDARGVFAAAANGDRWAQGIIGASSDAAATLMLNLQLLFDPDVILLGGGIGLADAYVQALRARLDLMHPRLRPDMRPAALGVHAGVIGAANMATSNEKQTRRKSS
jgi:N-acetylmannosamine-6-phosphate 2-epimerase/N-acetylmannosamine kinase